MMLITRSTPRITYRIGIRAVLAILKDKSLPLLLVGVDDDVAAVFKLWNLNFIGEPRDGVENSGPRTLPKYSQTGLWARVWPGTADVRRRTSDLGPLTRP